MRRRCTTAILFVLFLTGLGTGCGLDAEEVGREPDRSSSETPTTSGEPTSTESTESTDSTEGQGEGEGEGVGDTGALCDHLKVIADADLAVSSMPDDEKAEAITEGWPDVAAAYDDAIALAPPDLAEDLRAIKRLSELMLEALNGTEDGADPTAALEDLTERHRDEVAAGVLASMSANEFTEDECGFSLHNE